MIFYENKCTCTYETLLLQFNFETKFIIFSTNNINMDNIIYLILIKHEI